MKEFTLKTSHSKIYHYFYIFLKTLIRVFFRVLYRVEVSGRQNIPSKGRLIVCSNHISYADPLIIGAYFPRIIFFMAKIEIFRNNFFTSVLKFFNSFPVNRNAFDRQAIRLSLEVLNAEGVVGIFPEGTRSPEGNIREGQRGVGLISVLSSCNILPIAISGTNMIIQKPHKRLFFPKVRLIFGEIIDSKSIIEEKGSRQSAGVIVEKTMESIANLYKKINI